MPDANGRDRRLPALLLAVRGCKNALIQVHNNPDPDAIGCAVGLQTLYRRFLNVEARIVFGGIVGRAENRAMLRHLRIEIVPAGKVDYADCEVLTLVDTQPGLGHALLPEGRKPEVVIDHHPPRGEVPDGVRYWDVGRPYGATSTIVAELFTQNGIRPPRNVATALLYGIKSDTHDLSEGATPADMEAYRQLLPLADNAILAQIERAPVPRSYFAVFQRAIENAVVYDFAVVSHLSKIDNPDMVAEVADFLLRCEDLRWSLVTGIYKNTLYLSLRTNSKNAHAGSVARRAVGVMGYAGGHGRMAGGQIPLGEADRKTREEVVQAVTDLFLDAVKAKRSLDHSLAGGALPEETDTMTVEPPSVSMPPFGGAELAPVPPERARVVLLPVPYERTTTYRKGTANGPRALLDASGQVELFDEELRLDPMAQGVATLPALDSAMAPERLAELAEEAVSRHLAAGRIVGCLGGEHSLSLGPIRAAAKRHPGLGVLQVDAHPDLRDSYEGTRYGHGCVMRRVLDERGVARIVQVGLRAVSPEDDAAMREAGERVKPMLAASLARRPAAEWIAEAVGALPEKVYVSFDLDGLDPSVVPGTGTPEPGGLSWWDALALLRETIAKRTVVAFDVVELLPEPPSHVSDFAAARLVFKILAYLAGRR